MSLVTRLSNLIKKKTNLSYGLEITDSVIRLAAVPKEGASFAPKVLYEHPLDFIPDSLHAVNVTPAMKKALRHIVSHYGIQNIHVGIPERHFFFRCIRIPEMKDPESTETLHQIIDDYLVNEVVLPRSDVVCEYEIVAEEDGVWYVAIAVVPKFVLRRYFSLLQMVRLVPVTIEANVHAMHRSCIEDLAEDISIVARIEKGTAHLAMVGGGAVLFDRDYVLPKTNPNAFLEDEITKFYRDWTTMPYRNEFERKTIKNLTLFGGKTDLEELKTLLERRLRIPVRMTRPIYSHIETNHDVPSVHSGSMHKFSAAIGLALQGR